MFANLYVQIINQADALPSRGYPLLTLRRYVLLGADSYLPELRMTDHVLKITHRQVRVTNQVLTITNQKRNYAPQAELLTVGGGKPPIGSRTLPTCR